MSITLKAESSWLRRLVISHDCQRTDDCNILGAIRRLRRGRRRAASELRHRY